MRHVIKRALSVGIAGAVVLVCLVGQNSYAAAPTNIRVARGPAAEGPLWTMVASPNTAVGQGSIYDIELTFVPGSAKRLQLFQAGGVDMATSSAEGALQVAGKGFDFKILAALSIEGGDGFATHYVVRADSKIQSIDDVRGKRLGIVAPRSSTQVWAQTVLRKHGIDPVRGVKWLVLPFSSQLLALQHREIDIAVLPQPFFAFAKAEGGIRTLFTSRDAMESGSQDLVLLLGSEAFLRSHPAAVKAFMRDLASAAAYYSDPETHDTAVRAIVSKQFTSVPEQVMLNMKQYATPQDARVDVTSLQSIADQLLRLGYLRRALNVHALVDPDYVVRGVEDADDSAK